MPPDAQSWRSGQRHGAIRRAAADDPVFIAVRDTQSRFHIPDELLEQLIQGTAMDLQPEAMNRRGADGLDTFATFTDLYRYCYYVASVVGLVCIRIFGYSSPAAEKLAEETGIAFQLTNILRDVREDAERGRVYIPADELAASGTSAVDPGPCSKWRGAYRVAAAGAGGDRRGAHALTITQPIDCCH